MDAPPAHRADRALRERQREATRDQIVEAVHALLSEEHPSTLSMPQIAGRAGISLRTLYRYFPTKEALIDAASESFRVSADFLGGPVSAANLGEYLTAAWQGFTTSIGAVRAQHLTPAGRALRERRLPRNRAAVREALHREGIDVPADDHERLVDLVVTLMSSSVYLELVDRLGHREDEAARLAAWSVGAVIDRAKREGAVAP